MSGCCVVECKNTAQPDRGFYQIAETHGLRIRTSGLLCEEHWHLMMNGTKKEEKAKDRFKIKYCIECGKAAPFMSTTMFGCPICEKTVCIVCAMKHEKRVHAKETQQEDEPLEWAYQCHDCKKKILAIDTIKYNGIPYCANCWIQSELWKGQKQESPFTWEWHTEEAVPLCSVCKIKISSATGSYTVDGQIFCLKCWGRKQDQAREQHRKQQQYSNRYDEEFIRRQQNASDFIRNMYGDFFANFDNTKYSSAGTSGNTQQKQQSGTFTAVPLAVREAFKVLGITPTQDAEQIKKAYKALALQKHPDVGGKTEEMVKLNKAKEAALKYAGKK